MSKELERLEKWHSGHKSRQVTVEIGSSYGATCWSVHLYGNGKHLCCAETSFFGTDEDRGRTDWGPKKDLLVEHVEAYPEEYFSVVVDGDSMRGWPGLARTIDRALERADEIGM